MMRAVIYARYSSDLQSEASIEDQVRSCRAVAARHGWDVTDIYDDRAISGATMLRPGFQRLLEDARGRRFEVVIAEALDRMSRDQEDVAGIFKRLRFAGIAIHTVSEGEISELHVGLKGTMNALFLKDLAIKTHRGLRGRVEEGRSAGGLSYGYKVIRALKGDGELDRGGRSIDEGEAEVVRRIFTAASVGKSPRAIARELNGDGIPGPGGRPWGDTTIRGHHLRGTGILRNRLYIGELIWNRLVYSKDPDTGRRRSRLNPPADWTVKQVPELRIIDQDLWDRVEERLGAIRSSERVEKARAHRFWEKRRPRHLLTGKTFCASCGGPLASIGRDYLSCSAASRQGTCANRANIRRGALETTILDAMRRRLMAPELVAEFVSAFHAEINDQRRRTAGDRHLKERELADVTRQIEGLVMAIADGLRGPAIQQKLDGLEQRRALLAAALDGPEPSPVRLHPNLSELYRQKVERLEAAFRSEDTRTESLEILRGLIDRVRVGPSDDGMIVELDGDLAAMLDLGQGAAQRKTPASVEAGVLGTYAGSTKVVAGTGFEPVTFRL